MARPKDSTKLNDELQEHIVKTLRAGNYIETAAAYAGVSKQSIYNWMHLGREALKDEKPTKEQLVYVNFLDAVERALAESEIRDVMTIAQAAELGDWRAAAWRLERKCMQRWGPNMKVEHKGDINLHFDERYKDI